MTKSTPATNPAEAYEQVIAQGIFAVWTDDLLARAAPRPGEDVLDLACGTGMVTRRLVEIVHPGGTVAARLAAS